MKDCLKDMQLFVVCLFIIVVCGANIMFYIEKDHPETDFTSVPEGMWWSIETLVTIGYGDIIPKSLIGRVLASFYMVFGTLTIALPVLSVVIKFINHWSLMKADCENYVSVPKQDKAYPR